MFKIVYVYVTYRESVKILTLLLRFKLLTRQSKYCASHPLIISGGETWTFSQWELNKVVESLQLILQEIR